MNFDYATVRRGIEALWGSDQDVGKGIADLLVDKLVADGAYSVIERKELDKILHEQDFSNSDRADPATAAKIGRVLGVEVIVVGSITQFGRDDQSTGLSGLSSRLPNISRKKSTAVVGITARMINTSTAEILASASGKGESTRTGTGLGTSRGADLDMRSSNFGATILGEATNQAVAAVAAQLDAKAGSLPTQAITISGLVADAASDGTVTINVGRRAGVKVGDQLQVRRKVREIKDPATGRVIRAVEDTIGTVVVTDVDDQSAAGKFTGSSPAKVGDTVRSPS